MLRFKTKVAVKSALVTSLALATTLSCSKSDDEDDDEVVATTSSSPTASSSPSATTATTAETSELQLASSLTILPAKDSTTLALAGIKEATLKLANNRKLHLRMTNEAFEIIERAGTIMCFLGQTNFWDQAAASEAEAEVYASQVDNNLCETSSGESGSDDSSSSSSGPDLEDVYVKAWRTPGLPLIAELLVDGKDGQYHVDVIVVEGPSDYAPAGIFQMNYNAVHAGKVIGGGYIHTSRVAAASATETPKFLLNVGMNDNDPQGRSGETHGFAELAILSNGEATGYVNSSSTGSEKGPKGNSSFTSSGKARFDENFLNVDFSSTYTGGPDGQSHTETLSGCYDKNKYRTTIFRYDLVDAAGNVVKRNSGFPMEFKSSSGEMQQGWAGYHGVMARDGNVSAGTTITKLDFSIGGKEPVKTNYTVFEAPGKLFKLTKASTTLGALKNIDLRSHDNGSEYIVKWDGSNLVKSAKITFGNKGMVEEAASGNLSINEWGTNLWVPSLNANIRLSKSMTLSDDLSISYHSESLVSGTTGPSCNLVCFSNCPVMAPASSAFVRSQSMSNGPSSSALYHTVTQTWSNGQSFTSNQARNIQTALATYTWDSTLHNIVQNGTAFALPSDLSTGGQGGGGGGYDNIHSGALVCSDALPEDRSMDAHSLEHKLDVFYRFQSGADRWNKFQGVKDVTGAFVAFDAPLVLSYTHSTANDFDGNSTFNGKSYRIEYGGPGELRMPWKYNKDIGREMPEINLKPGTPVGSYFAQPLDGEQRLVQVDAASCAALSLSSIPELSTVEKPENADVEVVHTWSYDDAPIKYISGEAVTN